MTAVIAILSRKNFGDATGIHFKENFVKREGMSVIQIKIPLLCVERNGPLPKYYLLFLNVQYMVLTR